MPCPTDIAIITGIHPWSKSDHVMSASPMSPSTHEAVSMRRREASLSIRFKRSIMFPQVS